MSMFNEAFIRSNTQQARDDDGPAEVVLTEKQKAILTAVNEGKWGCQEADVRALVSAITGVDCTVSSHRVFNVGTLIQYCGETVLIAGVYSDGDAVPSNRDGINHTRHGNNHVPKSAAWHYASDEEITAFFA